MKCLIIDAVHSAIAEELGKYMQVDTHMLPTQEELVKLIPDYDVLIMRVDPKITKEIIDHATVGSGFGRLLTGYVLLLLGMQGISVLSTLLTALVTERFSFGIRRQIYEKILHSGWREVTAYHTGDLMTRLTSDAGNVADGIVGTIPNILQLGIELVLVFCMLFYYSPLLAVFALLVAPVAALCSWWLGKRLKRLQRKVQESESEYRSFLQEVWPTF